MRELNERLEKAMEKAIAERSEIDDRIQTMERNAVKLNGGAVYRTRDHRTAFTARGREVTEAEFEGLQPKFDALKSEVHEEEARPEYTARHTNDSIIAKIDAAKVTTNGDDLTQEEFEKLSVEYPDESNTNSAAASALSADPASSQRTSQLPRARDNSFAP